jgi:hypothetical protein
MQTLKINIDKAREKVPDAIRQAYCIVVTVSEKDEAHAFKLSISDQNHFETIKNDPRSRVRDTAITADALLPDGPYNLWQDGDKSRRVKDLAGAFAQLPHLPKMLKSSAIVETLVEGCLQGSFVLKVTRPDRSFRTWWRDRPDEAALADPSLELVLPEHAELADVLPRLLSSSALPGLWAGEEITAQSVLDYFSGKHIVEVDRGSYKESVHVPRANQEVIELTICNAVAAGYVWLLSGPSSLWSEEVPQGILTPAAKLRVPPESIAPAALLPETLPGAWKNDSTNAAAIATALSHQSGLTLPWKNVASAISAAITGRFLSLADDSGDGPCDFAMATKVKFTIVKIAGGSGSGGDPAGGGYQGPSGHDLGSVSEKHGVRAVSEIEVFELQELGESVAALLDIKNKCDAPLTFSIQIDFGDAQHKPSPEVVTEMNSVLAKIRDGLKLT